MVTEDRCRGSASRTLKREPCREAGRETGSRQEAAVSAVIVAHGKSWLLTADKAGGICRHSQARQVEAAATGRAREAAQGQTSHRRASNRGKGG